MRVLPNFLYIGPDKAGSTWIFQLFSRHPDIFVTPAKDLYFFDRYFDKGLEWYARQFDGGAGHKVVAEISHDYLYDPAAALRIKQALPDTRLMVCLREPCQRAFSGYLYLVKSGFCSGSFAEALDAYPDIVNRGMYGKHLSTYLEHFSRDRIYVAVFDDLQHDSQRFADQLFDFLGVPSFALPEELQQNVLPAGKSRSARLTFFVKRAADVARGLGLPKLVGRIKSSPLVHRLLFQPYAAGEKPRPDAASLAKLRDVFAPDLARLDELLDTNFRERWQEGPAEHVTDQTQVGT